MTQPFCVNACSPALAIARGTVVSGFLSVPLCISPSHFHKRNNTLLGAVECFWCGFAVLELRDLAIFSLEDA